MGAVLHPLPPGPAPAALAVIARQAGVGDRVTVVMRGEASAPPLPAGVAVLREGRDLSYPALLDLILAADRVTVW